MPRVPLTRLKPEKPFRSGADSVRRCFAITSLIKSSYVEHRVASLRQPSGDLAGDDLGLADGGELAVARIYRVDGLVCCAQGQKHRRVAARVQSRSEQHNAVFEHTHRDHGLAAEWCPDQNLLDSGNASSV